MLAIINEFLAQRRLAIVGVSHQPNHFSRMLLRAFRERNFEVAPVNPAMTEVEGISCYARVQDIQPSVDTALLMTSPAVTGEVVKDCADAGIRRVWMYRRSPAAVTFCEAHGMEVIAGVCPMMFLPKTGLIHRFHGWLHGVR
jgi:predicted CoA-binding protein